MRFPRPLQPGDKVGVTAPSMGVNAVLDDALEVGLDLLRSRGLEPVVGDCLRSPGEGVVSAPAHQRAAELTAMLADPDIAGVVAVLGGDLAIGLLDLLDWDLLAGAEPTWLVGPSDITTLQVPLALRLGWGAGLHSNGLLASGHPVPEGLLHWLDVASAVGGTVQRSPGVFHTSAFVAYSDGRRPEVSFDGRGGWRLVGAETLDVTGRLIGGCIETVANLAGTAYGDVPGFGAATGEGLVVFVEASESTATEVGRRLHGMRLAGWFDHAKAILVGRTYAPDDDGLTQEQAVLDALGGLGVPLVLDVECGHVLPRMPMVQGALTRVLVQGDDHVVEQELR